MVNFIVAFMADMEAVIKPPPRVAAVPEAIQVRMVAQVRQLRVERVETEC